MISFLQLPLNGEIISALSKLHIDYVFQPIFKGDGKEIFAYEALMRPLEGTVLELIDEYKKSGELHVIEVATFFGAAQAYRDRGYKEPVCINSFPTEGFTKEEADIFFEFFGEYVKNGIIEMTAGSESTKKQMDEKIAAFREHGMRMSIDNFGKKTNDISHVDNAYIIKLDQSLICGIDDDKKKQKACKEYVKLFHSKGALVLAEGVETELEFNTLKALNVDLFQGYLLGKPC